MSFAVRLAVAIQVRLFQPDMVQDTWEERARKGSVSSTKGKDGLIELAIYKKRSSTKVAVPVQ